MMDDFTMTNIFRYIAYWLRKYYNDDNFDYKTRNYFTSEFCRKLIDEDKIISERLKRSANHVDRTLSVSLSRRFWARIKALFMEYDGDERTALYFLKKFQDVYYLVVRGDNHVDFPFLTICFQLEKHQYRLKSTSAPRASDTTVIVIDSAPSASDNTVIIIED